VVRVCGQVPGERIPARKAAIAPSAVSPICVKLRLEHAQEKRGGAHPEVSVHLTNPVGLVTLISVSRPSITSFQPTLAQHRPDLGADPDDDDAPFVSIIRLFVNGFPRGKRNGA